MSRWMKAFLTVGLCLGLTSFALGQRPGFGPGGLLMNPDVQKELKVSEDQISKLKDAMGKVMEDHKGDFEKFREMSSEDRQKAFRKIGADTNKAISGVLDDKQMKRYKQLEWQIAGPNALADPELQKALKLSDEQKKKVNGVFADSQKKMQELFQGGNREGIGEKIQGIQKDTEKHVNAVLTDEQKKNLKELKGAPFDFKRPGA